ncbi:hypothetical protein NN561_013455 [Cricetulus griseus]
MGLRTVAVCGRGNARHPRMMTEVALGKSERKARAPAQSPGRSHPRDPGSWGRRAHPPWSRSCGALGARCLPAAGWARRLGLTALCCAAPG